MEDPKPNTTRIIMPIHEALRLLRPKANWGVEGDNYEDIKWYDDPSTMPTKEEVMAKAQAKEQAILNVMFMVPMVDSERNQNSRYLQASQPCSELPEPSLLAHFA